MALWPQTMLHWCPMWGPPGTKDTRPPPSTNPSLIAVLDVHGAQQRMGAMANHLLLETPATNLQQPKTQPCFYQVGQQSKAHAPGERSRDRATIPELSHLCGIVATDYATKAYSLSHNGYAKCLSPRPHPVGGRVESSIQNAYGAF